jgi:hypothetical protein
MRNERASGTAGRQQAVRPIRLLPCPPSVCPLCRRPSADIPTARTRVSAKQTRPPCLDAAVALATWLSRSAPACAAMRAIFAKQTRAAPAIRLSPAPQAIRCEVAAAYRRLGRARPAQGRGIGPPPARRSAAIASRPSSSPTSSRRSSTTRSRRSVRRAGADQCIHGVYVMLIRRPSGPCSRSTV